MGIYFLKYYTKFIIVILFQFGLKIMIRTIFQKQLILIRVFSLLFLFLSTSILYADNTNSAQELTTFEQIEKMRIGVLGASANKEILQNKAPNAKNFSFFNTNVDGVSAVISNKVDCYIDDEPVLRLFVNRNPGIKLASLVIDSFDYGIALKKNNPLTSKISQVINDFRKKGVLDELKKLWLGKDESKKTVESIPTQNWEGKNGTIKFFTSADCEPLCYLGNNQTLIGYDIHLIYLLAKELDMKVEPTVAQFDSLIPALESGKADIVVSCMTITEERQKSVDMIPYYNSSAMAIVRDESSVSNQSLFQRLKESFNKTFLIENRWVTVLKGLGVTIVISLASGVLGFLLGFLFIIINRKNNKCFNWLIKAFVSLVGGIPTVVLLMLLYYVIFGSVDISPVLVSIIAFTITFGTTCYRLIGNGIQAVNIGQEEAAKAIGFTDFQSFYKIIFPQATKQFLPLMKDEFISMVKMTSVVGYVACIDLTKASDLIRARTMEAFFPLITTALIYYIVANLMIMSLNKFEISLDPKRRERKLAGIIEEEPSDDEREGE